MEPNSAHATFTLGQLITVVVAALGGITVIVGIFAAGVWDKFVKSKVRVEIKTYHSEPDNQDAFDKSVNRVIDNSINRRDGAIQIEINKQVKDGNQEVLEEVQRLRNDLSGVAEVGKRLGHIEGQMTVIMNALRVQSPSNTSTSESRDAHPHTPPRSPGG